MPSVVLPPKPPTHNGWGDNRPMTLPSSTACSSTRALAYSLLYLQETEASLLRSPSQKGRSTTKTPTSPDSPEPPRAPAQALGLLAFTEATYPDYQAGAHHRLIVEKLEAVERGEIRRLMLFVPPRHGKSELASVRFPAWYLGRDPRRKIIHASYGSSLSYKFSRRVRNLVKSPLFGRLYPGIELQGDAAAVQFWAWTYRGREAGAFNSAGVGGGITGEGCDLLIIDDPVKDAQEAMSLTVRDATYEWYASTAYTRLDRRDNAIVLIQTRWHEDDLAGRLLQQQAEGGEAWEVVELPALATSPGDALGREAGQPLWPARFDAHRLQITRSTVGENWWGALYQQKPPETLGGRYFRAFQAKKDGAPWHVWPASLCCERYGLTDGRFPPAPGEHNGQGWQLWAAVDGGVRDPYCCLWLARSPDRRRVFVWDEQYATGVTPLRQAQRLKARVASVGGRWLDWWDEGDGPQSLAPSLTRARARAPASATLHLDSVRVDPALFVPRANVGVSDAHVYANVGLPIQKAFNPRVPGWRRVLEALEPLDGDGLPGLVVVEGAAPNLVRTLPRLTADPDDPEDIEDGQEDHAADALRYGVNPAAAPAVTRRGLTLYAEQPEAPEKDTVGLSAYSTGFGVPMREGWERW